MEYKTLIEIYQSDPGLQKEFPDMMGKGVSGEWDLNDWWNRYGKVDYPNVTLVQPGDSRLTESDSSASEHITARFEGKDKVFLYDKDEKTYRPILNPTALMKLLGVSTIEEAFQHVTVLSPEDRNAPEWAGNIISESASIKDDGAVPTDSPIVKDSQVGDGKVGIYGKNKVSDDAEKAIANNISFALTDAKLKGEISEEAFDKYLNSQSETLAKYASAWLYGGYSVQDIFRDLKAKQLFDEGDERYKDFKGFDDNMSAEEWYQTEEGKKSLADSLLAPPSTLAISDDVWKLPLFKIPDEAFTTLVQPLDINSPEFKEEAEKIQASYYDIMMQKAEADTEQAKAVADNNWEIFKKNVEKKLGIELSNNAKAAWGQLQEAFSGFTERGLGDSGLFNEAMDKYLGSVRDNDQLKREGKIENEEMELRNHLLKTGTSEEIADFINKHGREKAEEWGLIPNAETLAWFSKENLKSLYPDMSDEEIDTIIGMVVDENGNFKSEIQQNLYTNKYNLQKQKEAYQQQKLQEQKLIEEEEAYRPFTSDDSMSSWLGGLQETIEGEEGEPVEEEVEEEEGITPTATYEDLYEKDGTIYNSDGTVYGTPADLAIALGINEADIDWNKIRKEGEEAPTEITPEVTAPVSVSYNDLENRNGTIYNKITGQAYSNPADLATALGISPHQIDWNQISQEGVAPAEEVPVSTTVDYSQLENRNGTIYNTVTGQAYSNPADLAKALGIPPHEINWGQISVPSTPSVTQPSIESVTPSATGSYSSLVNKNGTIYAGDKAFQDPTELAGYLGIQPHEIDWGQIQQYSQPSATMAAKSEPYKPPKLDIPKQKPYTPPAYKPPTYKPAPTPTSSPYYDIDKSGKRPTGWQGEWTVKDQGQLRFGRLKRQ